MTNALVRKLVVILPYKDNRVLMQLRDFDPAIKFPGHWGFFGGSVEEGEHPLAGARRELAEETGFQTDKLHVLDEGPHPTAKGAYLHAYFCALNQPFEQLSLGEGFDWGLFMPEEIAAGELYSQRAGKKAPVIPAGYISQKVEMLFDRVGVI